MNTTQLEYFLVLSKTLNYSKASEALGIAQPTLSKAIRHLEEECGFDLVKRNGRTIELTPEAIKFLPYIKESIAILNKGLNKVSFEKETISIGCVLGAANYLPDAIAAIHKISRNCFIQIKNGVSKELISKMINHECDIIFCTSPDRYDQLTFEPLFEQKLYLCVYNEHPYASLTEARIELLENQSIVAHTKTSLIHQLYEKMVEEKGIRIHIIAEADEDNQLLALVRQKMGITIVATNDPAIYHGVTLIPLKQDKIHRMISIGYHTDDKSIIPYINAIKNHVN